MPRIASSNRRRSVELHGLHVSLSNRVIDLAMKTLKLIGLFCLCVASNDSGVTTANAQDLNRILITSKAAAKISTDHGNTWKSMPDPTTALQRILVRKADGHFLSGDGGNTWRRVGAREKDSRAPALEWAYLHTMDTIEVESPKSIHQLLDRKGFVIVASANYLNQIYRIDPQGELKWSTSYGITDSAVSLAFVESESEQIACVLGVKSEGWFFPGPWYLFRLFIDKVTGDIEKTSWVYSSQTSMPAGTAITRRDDAGYLLAVGGVKLAACDATGLLEWERTYKHQSPLAVTTHLTSISDGYLATGWMTGDNASNRQLFIQKFDFDGDSIWTGFLSVEGRGGYMSSQSIELPDRTIMSAGTTWSPLDSFTSAVVLSRFASEGRTIWVKEYPQASHALTRKILRLSRGTFAVLGRVGSEIESSFYLAFMSESGEVIDQYVWRSEFPQNELTAALEADGALIVSGTSSLNGIGKAYVAKVQLPVAIVNHTLPVADAFVIRPNPVLNELVAELKGLTEARPKVMVTDLAGRIHLIPYDFTLTANDETRLTVGTHGLPRGYYSIQVTSGSTQLTQKFIKE